MTATRITPANGSIVDEREREALDKIARARAVALRAPKFLDERITMAHGAGGKATASLVGGLFAPAFASPSLALLDDAGAISVDGVGLAVTTDSFVVRPLRFPGGSIGELAVNGTVNDLAMVGARPLGITIAMVLEEGLSTDVLREEVAAIARAANVAGVEIIAGDTKVVERGHADRMYICTTGVGRRDQRAGLSPAGLRPGDRVIVSGFIGEHGMAIMLARGEFELDSEILSDTRPLWPAADALLDLGGDLRCMRDATRGGVATVLNELAVASSVSIVVDEGRVPVRSAVTGACELLGMDPMYVANEGTFVAVVAPETADRALSLLRQIPGSESATVIGTVTTDATGMVLVNTAFGGRRVMDLLVGDPLPRIC
ncbi:MAG TPA: hydrogenase expression/formation protein HypE [Gemmatimonadaceae bacterium]|jgi:hydrogenase expression/formation protein HypE|nr:hydrogenase expression/formation protein HypE [Gemmatimonadaceae bacterium]